MCENKNRCRVDFGKAPTRIERIGLGIVGELDLIILCQVFFIIDFIVLCTWRANCRMIHVVACLFESTCVHEKLSFFWRQKKTLWVSSPYYTFPLMPNLTWHLLLLLFLWGKATSAVHTQKLSHHSLLLLLLLLAFVRWENFFLRGDITLRACPRYAFRKKKFAEI